MNKITYFLIPVLFCSLVFSSCEYNTDSIPGSVLGYVPVYFQRNGLDTVRFEEPQPTTEGSDIFLNGTLLYQIDLFKGIHIVDFTDPENTQKIGFYYIPGCDQMTIEGNRLYTNSFSDLLIIDIAEWMNPKIISYQPFHFHQPERQIPPKRGYFECVDPSKGVVISWQEKTVNSPECKY